MLTGWHGSQSRATRQSQLDFHASMIGDPGQWCGALFDGFESDSAVQLFGPRVLDRDIQRGVGLTLRTTAIQKVSEEL